jgi:cell wall-associated NlpC family hydrolase
MKNKFIFIMTIILLSNLTSTAHADTSSDKATWNKIYSEMKVAETNLKNAQDAYGLALGGSLDAADTLAADTNHEALIISGSIADTTIAHQLSTQALNSYVIAQDNVRKAYADLNVAQEGWRAVLRQYGSLYKGSNATVFVDSAVLIPGAPQAIERSLSFVGHPGLACGDNQCRALCDHLAGEAWGYANSGYYAASTHWAAMLASGNAHPGNIMPPIGALLFWNTGDLSHVAVYVGHGMIVTNAIGVNGYSVYMMPATDISTKWRAPYLGWSDPIFIGEKV